jgi:hypothetical protein
MTNVPQPPRMHWARGSNFVARILAGQHCPQCRRELRATDVVYHDKDGTEITCSGCHQKVVLNEPLNGSDEPLANDP